MNMTRLVILSSFLLVYPTTVFSQQLAAVNRDDPALRSAISEGRNLLGGSSGFESSGGGDLSQAKLPVVGVLPSKIKTIFDRRPAGFESAKSGPASIDLTRIKALQVAHGGNFGYTLSYHIADNLDASWSATRYKKRVTGKPLLAPSTGMTCEASADGNTADGQWSARCQLPKFGITYYTTIFCSAPRTRPYCKTAAYAESFAKIAEILFPGLPD
ncbi:hypothetical protein [Bradyrhizobium sp. Y36]|uniref:hypothetical protein n=1 Tax=Bradyrhizobium sp. Y36 TaxID=2035447 RepID=UPI001178BEF7|nr:hypothetical protein [Bradyrhizobium sp. Y36]